MCCSDTDKLQQPVGYTDVSLQVQHTSGGGPSLFKQLDVQAYHYSHLDFFWRRRHHSPSQHRKPLTQQCSITPQKTWILWSTAMRTSDLTYTTHYSEYFLLVSNSYTTILEHKPRQGSELECQFLPPEAQIMCDNIHNTLITTLYNKTLPLARQTSLNFNKS